MQAQGGWGSGIRSGGGGGGNRGGERGWGWGAGYTEEVYRFGQRARRRGTKCMTGHTHIWLRHPLSPACAPAGQQPSGQSQNQFQALRCGRGIRLFCVDCRCGRDIRCYVRGEGGYKDSLLKTIFCHGINVSGFIPAPFIPRSHTSAAGPPPRKQQQLLRWMRAKPSPRTFWRSCLCGS